MASKPMTHQAMLRCGAVAVLAQYSFEELGEFCFLGNVRGEVHSWRADGRWRRGVGGDRHHELEQISFDGA